MQRFLPRGITGRLIIYLALIGVLPPLMVGMVSYHVSQGIVRNEMQRHTEQLLQAQSDYLEAQVEQVEGLIGNILGVETITDIVERQNGELDTYDQLATQARIGYLLNGYMDLRGLVSIDIFTSDGRHYHVGDTLDVHSIDEARRDALFAAVAQDPDETLWAGAETNVNGKSRVPRVIATARAINAFDGAEQGSRVAGLLLVSQDVNYLHAAFRRLEGEMPGRLLLVDGKDRIIYHRDIAMIGTLVPPGVVAALAGAHGTSQRCRDDGERGYFAEHGLAADEPGAAAGAGYPFFCDLADHYAGGRRLPVGDRPGGAVVLAGCGVAVAAYPARLPGVATRVRRVDAAVAGSGA